MTASLGAALARLLAPFARLFSQDGEFFWPYILGFALVGAIIWVARGLPGNLLAFLFPPSVYRTPSAQLDIRYFAINVLFYGLLVAPLLINSVLVAHLVVIGLVHAFGVPAAPIASGPLAAVLAAAALAIAGDFGFFISHFLHHKVPALWAFHKVHHAAEALHPLTAFRSHPVNLAVDFTVTSLVSGVMTALLAYVFDAGLTPALVLGVNVFNFAFQAAGAQLRHSHIWLDYGPRWSRVLVSPAMHQLHHSAAPQHRDKNLGGIFAFWDALCGTLFVPQAEARLELGLPDGESRHYRRVLDLYFRPLQDLARMLLSLVASKFGAKVKAG